MAVRYRWFSKEKLNSTGKHLRQAGIGKLLGKVLGEMSNAFTCALLAHYIFDVLKQSRKFLTAHFRCRKENKTLRQQQKAMQAEHAGDCS